MATINVLCREILREIRKCGALKGEDTTTWPLLKELIRNSQSNDQIVALRTFNSYIRSSSRHRVEWKH
jgi:hypothetical protein